MYLFTGVLSPVPPGLDPLYSSSRLEFDVYVVITSVKILRVTRFLFHGDSG